MKILITGGAGYVGSELVSSLIKKNHEITVLDLMIYGEEVLYKSKNLTTFKGDIRDKELLKKILPGHDVIIHLACISNDPSYELNPSLGKSINLDAFEPLVKISKESKVERFIYASSSSVYGIKNEKNVTEDMSLEPLTDYSKYKAECEKILFNYGDKNFCPVVIRPATVCGFSKRQRLDVVVNILTNLAFHKRRITVFGGDQLRPNLHIKDMIRAYELLIDLPSEKVFGKTYNVGIENHKVKELANFVKDEIGEDIKIETKNTDDNRSYHISSEKIKNELNFEFKFSIKDAIRDLKIAFEQKILTNSLNNEKYFNLKRMKNLDLK